MNQTIERCFAGAGTRERGDVIVLKVPLLGRVQGPCEKGCWNAPTLLVSLLGLAHLQLNL